MIFGWRIIKTGLAVALCLWIAQLLKFEYPFYSAIAAVIAMQATIADTFKQGLHRMQGTLVGALTGYVFALVMVKNPWWTGLGLILTLMILKWMRWTEAMNIAGIVFIAITINLTGRPLNYAFNRIIDTLVGLTVAFLVNSLVFPPRYQKELEDSFQKARHKVIELYRVSFLSLLNPKAKVADKGLNELLESIQEVNILVDLKRKERLGGTIDRGFARQYIGPLSRLEQMSFAIAQIINLREHWIFPLSAGLETDLIKLLNRSFFLLSLITQPDSMVAAAAYEETAESLEKVQKYVLTDQTGDYAGANREAVLGLVDWIEQMTKASSGCLKLTSNPN